MDKSFFKKWMIFIAGLTGTIVLAIIGLLIWGGFLLLLERAIA